MFRKALLALALLFASAPAFAQNTTCSDRAQTDSSNACANTRFVQSHTNTVVVPISAYGAKCDNSTDDTASIQNAWNAAAAIGSNVWLGGVGIGICRISSLTMPTPTGTGKASFLTGPGSGSVQLSSSVTGTTCAITSTVTYGTNSYIEGAFSGFELAQRNQTQTGYGFCANNWTKGNFVDVKFSWFFRGFSGIDVTSIGFLNSTFLDNQIGAYGAMFVNTPPNDWSFIDNKFQNNGKNAISLTGPNLTNISFNEFQAGGYNSGQAPTATIDIIGPPGGPVVGANIINNYFEGNDGSAEIRINQNAVANAVAIYNINNNTIVRTLSTQAAGILIVNSGTGTAKTTVNVGGNGFYDNTGVAGGFLWLSASTAGTTNYIFNCTGSNRADIAAEMPTLCQNNVANTVPMVDANAQYIGYGTKLQLTALINVATASLSGAVPAWPNNTTTFFRGDGTYATPTAGSISGGLPLTETNDTNVTMTLGGTPATALLQSVSMTLGWTGTLAVARGGTASASASGTALDNITGFAGTGFIKRTGAGTYTFTADPSDVTSVFGRTGAVVSATNDYNFTQLAGTISVAQVGGSGASHAVPVDVAGTITWKVISDCNGATTALNYTQATDAFSCNSSITANSATTAATATNATNTAITDDTTTNATMNLTWVTSNTGNLPQKVSSTKLNFNPSTGLLSSSQMIAANDTTGGFVIKNSGGTADSAFYEGAGGSLVFKMGTVNIWSLATNALSLVIDYSSTNSSAVTITPASFHTGKATFANLIVPNSGATLTCGSGCSSVTGNPQKMAVTTGAAQTSVTVNFGITWTAVPVCTISSNSTASVVDISSTTTTAITFGASVALTGAVINALCF